MQTYVLNNEWDGRGKRLGWKPKQLPKPPVGFAFRASVQQNSRQRQWTHSVGVPMCNHELVKRTRPYFPRGNLLSAKNGPTSAR